jgi:signal transduction histidine kinase
VTANCAGAESEADAGDNAMHKASSPNIDAIPPLRWLLIIATSYLVVFSRPLSEAHPLAALYVAAYLATGLFWASIRSCFRRPEHLISAVILFDVLAVTIGLLIARETSGTFFGLYFLVILISVLGQRLSLVLLAALTAGVVHVAILSAFVEPDRLSLAQYSARLPFLFAVGLSVGQIAEQIRATQREAFEAAERERLHAEFVSSVIHDLKSPLGVIQVMLEMLCDRAYGTLNARQTRFVRLIQTSLHQVLTLSLNFLDANRIEAGHFEIHPVAADLRSLVGQAVARAHSAAEHNQIQLEFTSGPSLPPVEVDGLQIDRAVSNLIDNAIKYTPANGRVAVSVERTPADFVISVSDTGRGIPPEEAGVLFRKYQRGSQVEGVVGSGLGLFIVKAVADAHKGSVDLVGKPGIGTTARLHIPASRARPGASAA